MTQDKGRKSQSIPTLRAFVIPFCIMLWVYTKIFDIMYDTCIFTLPWDGCEVL